MEESKIEWTNIERFQTNRKLIIENWELKECYYFVVIRLGKLENFLKITKRGGSYLVHQSNAANLYSTYVPLKTLLYRFLMNIF